MAFVRFSWLEAAQDQAWVMLFGGLAWGLLDPDRAPFMALYSGCGGFFLYARSKYQTTMRTVVVLFAWFTLAYAGRIYQPYQMVELTFGQQLRTCGVEVLALAVIGSLIAFARKVRRHGRGDARAKPGEGETL